MTAYWLLAPLTLLCMTGCWLGYSEHKEASWYLWFGASLGFATNFLYFLGTRWLDNGVPIYRFCFAYDVVVFAVYYVMPLVFGWVELKGWKLAGFGCMVLAAILMHLPEEP